MAKTNRKIKKKDLRQQLTEGAAALTISAAFALAPASASALTAPEAQPAKPAPAVSEQTIADRIAKIRQELRQQDRIVNSQKPSAPHQHLVKWTDKWNDS